MLASLFGLLAGAQPVPALPATPVLPEGRALEEVVAARSDAYFTLYHDLCDPEQLRRMLLPDFEMYHDQNGVSASSAEAFISRYAQRCRTRSSPGGPRLRRQLLQGSRRIYPVPGYGAIEEGRHEYFGRLGNRPERKVTTARYLQLWKLTDDGWRVARAFSYDHLDEPRLPPINKTSPSTLTPR